MHDINAFRRREDATPNPKVTLHRRVDKLRLGGANTGVLRALINRSEGLRVSGVGLPDLAENAGVCTQTVGRRIRDLEKRGLLTIHRSRGRRPHRYLINAEELRRQAHQSEHGESVEPIQPERIDPYHLDAPTPSDRMPNPDTVIPQYQETKEPPIQPAECLVGEKPHGVEQQLVARGVNPATAAKLARECTIEEVTEAFRQANAAQGIRERVGFAVMLLRDGTAREALVQRRKGEQARTERLRQREAERDRERESQAKGAQEQEMLAKWATSPEGFLEIKPLIQRFVREHPKLERFAKNDRSWESPLVSPFLIESREFSAWRDSQSDGLVRPPRNLSVVASEFSAESESSRRT